MLLLCECVWDGKAWDHWKCCGKFMMRELKMVGHGSEIKYRRSQTRTATKFAKATKHFFEHKIANGPVPLMTSSSNNRLGLLLDRQYPPTKSVAGKLLCKKLPVSHHSPCRSIKVSKTDILIFHEILHCEGLCCAKGAHGCINVSAAWNFYALEHVNLQFHLFPQSFL